MDPNSANLLVPWQPLFNPLVTATVPAPVDFAFRINSGPPSPDCPAPVAGLADITALYTACFGPPPERRRIFLRASTMVSGFESLPREFRALVPAP